MTEQEISGSLQVSRQIGIANAMQAANLIDHLEKLEPNEIRRLVHLNC